MPPQPTDQPASPQIPNPQSPISDFLAPTPGATISPGQPSSPETAIPVAESQPEPATPAPPAPVEPTAPEPITPTPQALPSPPTPSAAQPPSTPQPPTNPPSPPKKGRGKKFWALIAVIAVIIVAGGAAYAYFGYYMSPGQIWKQSLKNTSAGYNQLVSYLNTQSSTQHKGINLNGSFKVNADGTNYDGSLTVKSYNSNSTASLKLDLGLANLDLEERSLVPSGANSPDVYLQLNGVKSLDSLLGGELGPQLDGLDGQWILIDHNLISDLKDQLSKQQPSTTTTTPTLTWHDVSTFLQSVGTVNSQYIFTTDKSKAVTTVVKNVGAETLAGHKTYHYKVGLVRQNVKAYLTALCTTYKQSQLGAWVAGATGEQLSGINCSNAADAANNIKTSSTFDVWVDTHTRLIYQVKVTDPSSANSFVALGLNYAGGKTYPFFINLQDEEGSSTTLLGLTANLNTSTGDVTLGLNAAEKDGSDTFTLNGNFSLAPNNTPITVTAPAGAQPLTNVLSQFGLTPDTLGQLLGSQSTDTTQNLTTGTTFNIST